MPPFSAFLVSALALIAALAIYLGGQDKSLSHRFSAISGILVVLCISVLPYYLFKAFGSIGVSDYEVGLIVYLAVFATSSVSALVFCLVLRRKGRRPAA